MTDVRPQPSTGGHGAWSPRRFRALVTYTWRGCLPPRRRRTLALPAVAAALFGLLARLNPPVDQAVEEISQNGVIGLLLPLGSLVIGDAVLGAEVRAGTIGFTWSSPARHLEIVLARWLGGVAVAWAVLVPACLLVPLIGGTGDAVVPLAAAVAAGSAAHVAVFVAIGAATRRAAVWSLAFVFLGERLLGSVLSGIAQLSPTWEAQQIFATMLPDGDDYLRDGVPQGLDAVIRLGLVAAVALGLATWALTRLELTGRRD